MSSLRALLFQQFQAAWTRAFPEHPFSPAYVELAESTQEKFGHYQCNSVMKLAKQWQQAPRQIAEKWLAELELEKDGQPFLEKKEVAGPGFINVWLHPSFLASCTDVLLKDKHLGVSLTPVSERVVIDFSSPNVAKEMHVGHLRSTILGDCLANVFEYLGYDVLRLNHVGDWGTAFGMLIAYLKEEQADVLTGKKSADVSSLMQWYRASKKRFDEDPNFKKQAQQAVIDLQQGDTATREAWKLICQLSREAYEAIYRTLGVRITERGESFYNDALPVVVAELETKGCLTISDGARCAFLPGFIGQEGKPLPLIVQKADGGYNYATTDVAALKQRIQVEKASRILYVIDSGQNLHVSMVFALAEQAGYLDKNKVRVEHIPFGLVLGEDNKKFRTRSGDTEKLSDLLETAVQKAATLLEERGQTDPAKRQETAEILGINAIKYADLACQRTQDYVFSYDRMLRFEGNTAAFVLYAYVRIASIKRKLGLTSIPSAPIVLSHPAEVALALQLARFSDVVWQLADDCQPHRLTEYLFHLAENFHAFFRDCRVEGAPEQASRLQVCEATARVLQQGMALLGLRTLNEM